ncbi:hypothetical protein SVIOM342S_02386 [Streptomyces violaceorubidus]
MPDISLTTVVLLCLAALAAGWIDAVVGGGGLLLLPALLLGLPSGTPAAHALGTNKAVAIVGTTGAAVTYARKAPVDVRTAVRIGLAALAGSSGGAFFAAGMSTEVLKPVIMVVLLAVAAFVILRPAFGPAAPQRTGHPPPDPRSEPARRSRHRLHGPVAPTGSWTTSGPTTTWSPTWWTSPRPTCPRPSPRPRKRPPRWRRSPRNWRTPTRSSCSPPSTTTRSRRVEERHRLALHRVAGPIGLVSYGGLAGGLRAAEHLRQVFAELHAVTVRDTVSFHNAGASFDDGGRLRDPAGPDAAAKTMLDQLVWWGRALREARERRPYDGA